jgi:hypothetical protein
MIDREKLKQALTAILIGALVSFFSVFFQELANFFKAHSVDMISGAASSLAYMVHRAPRA